jgi:hypothetical protein
LAVTRRLWTVRYSSLDAVARGILHGLASS